MFMFVLGAWIGAIVATIVMSLLCINKKEEEDMLERDCLLVSTDEEGNAVADLPITRVDNVEGIGRIANTKYAIGDTVYVDNNMKVVLVCVSSGITDEKELNISNAEIGTTIKDGTVVWRIERRLLVKQHIAELEGVVEENTNISAILNNLVADETISKIVLPKGTYNIENTININRPVMIEGVGAKATILNITCDVGFMVTTSYSPPFTLTNLGFKGTENNTLIQADRGAWGACFVVKNFYCTGFQNFCVAKSAFGVLVENGHILSNCKFTFTTHNDVVDNTNFSNVITFDRVIYIGSPNKSSCVFDFKNIIGVNISNCTVEKAEVLIKNQTTTRKVSVTDCWVEDVDYFVENITSDVAEVTIKHTQEVRLVAHIKGQTNSYFGREHYETYVESQLSGDNSSAYDKLLKETDTPFLERRVIGDGFDVPLISFNTNKGEIAVPVNIYKEVQKSVSGTSINLWSLFHYAGIAMLYKVYVYALYSDTSGVIYKAEVLSRNKDSFILIGFEKVFKGSWSTAQAEETCDCEITDKRNFTFASPNGYTFKKLEVYVEYKPLGESVT